MAELTARHRELGITEQLDYEKFYLYSLIVHSTAIEVSTVTEVEAQLLFDEGIVSSKRTMAEQLMNLDLRDAYLYGRKVVSEPITVEWLWRLSSMVMRRTGGEYNAMGGSFSAARGELQKLNVTAGIGGRSYRHYLKVPHSLNLFCQELNKRRDALDTNSIAEIYELSFWAHYELVTKHPWADGNGRMSRLLMNLLQMQFGVLPVAVYKEEKADYIQALIESREQEDVGVFVNKMAALHIAHLEADIARFLKEMSGEVADRSRISAIIGDKLAVIGDKSHRKDFIANLEEVCMFLYDTPNASAKTIADSIGKSASMTRYYLQFLAGLGMVSCSGANKNRRYSLAAIKSQNIT